MTTDPQYRTLVDKHGSMKQSGEIDVVTEEVQQQHVKWLKQAITKIEQSIHTMKENLGNMINNVMMKNMINELDVAEVYSPPRVVEMARRMGIRAGWSLDITTTDDDGNAWDFNKLAMRNKAVRKVLCDKPKLLIGSPICTPFSQMNNINHARMSEEEIKQRMDYGRKHLEFCLKLYDIQWREGRYFLHEHPQNAKSWQERKVKKFMENNGAQKVTGDQCMYGLKTRQGDHVGPARKSTIFMTNSPCIAQSLSRRCPNTTNTMIHQHIRLEGGRTRAAQIYPPELCKAICEGFKAQLEADRKGQFLLAEIQQDGNNNGGDMVNASRELKGRYETVVEDNSEEMDTAWGDVSGAELNPAAVRAARAEEIEYVHKMNLYAKVPIEECASRTGKQPTSVRWIDINKGDADHPNYRSRLVAREINRRKRDDLFAATPPLEALKIISSMAASKNKGEVIMINDVSRAFFHAKAKCEVFVQLPQEDRKPGEEHLCGRLKFSMYGTRGAALNWFEKYSQRLINIGFKQGLATPCVFYHQERAIRAYVHGDDYVSTGMSHQLKWLKQELEKQYQIKTQVLGGEEGHLKEVKILNRIVVWKRE